ncbi:MAG TPA: fused MFS/spermidine synthase, partial [Thermoanaerobaculia bacterium]|nr:fused MFS/spermidine synthase [Thermoanaerobaculia bacterium]
MSRPLRISALLFGSGMTALIYQVAWMRELRLVFGFSTAASAAVVAIFMGGLGIGGWLLGRRADIVPRPLAFYGWLEVAVALSAAVTPALLWLVRAAYIAVGGSLRLGIAGGSIVRLLLSAIVLAAPTVLMGGTLPAATRAAETEEDAGRRYLALLYGSNTLGAVAGTLISTFYLLERLGTRETLWAACLVNVAVGLAAVVIARQPPLSSRGTGSDRGTFSTEPRDTEFGPARQETEPAKKSASKQRRADRRAGIVPTTPEPPVAAVAATVAVPERFVLGAAAITGFVFTLMELVWYRMLGPLLGGSTYTFGLILAVALFGIGAGSLARARSKRPGTLAGFAATCAIEALVLAVPYGLGDSVAILAARLRPEGAFTFGQLVSGWTVVAGLVVFPAAFVSGYQFPVLISLLGRGREKVGTQVGLAYAWNTAGAIVGSLAGGFGLLPLLSATGTWIFVTVLLSVLALASVAVSRSRGESGPKALWVPLAGAAAGVALLFTAGPTAAWRHSPIGAGRVNLSKASPNRIEEWLRDQRRRTFWEKDGVESSVAMTTTSGGLAFVVNGKIDGNTRTDAPTQVMGGLIGAAVHPGPRSALVIGLGTGSTAGWLASVPSIERVDVVELEPAILKVAERSAPVNRNVLANPKVKVTIRDAREYLLTSKDRYDLIFSEPSNPYRAGISSLFTADFYAAARDRLAPGGIFLQWLQSYEVVPETVRSVYATLQTAFPVIESWFSRDRDLILAASAASITYDADGLRARLAGEPFRSAMLDAWTTEGLEGFLSHYVARSSMVPALLAAGPAPKNTDDKNIIEFAFARSLGSQAAFDLDSARSLARKRHEDAPPLAKGSADWGLVRRLRISTITADGVAPRERPDMTAEEIRQCRAQKAFLEGHPENALDLWREKPWEPVGPVELAVISQALAFAGDESSAGYIGRLSASRPVDALILLGELRWRQGRFPEAADLYEKALTRYREDPWALLPVVNRSFTIVADLAGRDRAFAGKMDAALSQPFAVQLLNEERLQTRYKVATFLDQSKLEDAIAALEPYVPWRKGLLSRRARLYETTRNPLA